MELVGKKVWRGPFITDKCEKLRLRVPVIYNTHNAKDVVVDRDRLAQAVAAAKHLLVQVIADHHCRYLTRVIVRAPAAAVLKRHIQHGEKLAVHCIATGIDQAAILVGALRHNRTPHRNDRRLTNGPMLTHQRHCIDIGQRSRRLAIFAVIRPPRIDLRDEES